MFDVSFTELLVIGVVALIVIGPERLPKVARTVGHLVGRAQRYVNDVKSDIKREVELDELRSLKEQMQEAAQTVKASFQETDSSLRNPMEAFEKDTMAALKGTDSEPVLPETVALPEPVLSDSPSALAHVEAASPTPVSEASTDYDLPVELPAMPVTPAVMAATPATSAMPVITPPTQLEIDAVAAAPTPSHPNSDATRASAATPRPGSPS